MVSNRPGDTRGGHPRSRIERRLVVFGIATVLVLVIPGLRSAAVQLLVGIVTLVALLGLLAVLALAIAWRVARRHPVADLLVATWLLRRHERRRQQIVDARAWLKERPAHEARSWTPGTRTRRW